MLNFTTAQGNKVKEYKKEVIEITRKGDTKPSHFVTLDFLIDSYIAEVDKPAQNDR